MRPGHEPTFGQADLSNWDVIPSFPINRIFTQAFIKLSCAWSPGQGGDEWRPIACGCVKVILRLEPRVFQAGSKRADRGNKADEKQSGGNSL